MVEDKKEKKQKNKGVSVNPLKATKENIYFSDTDTYSQSVGPAKSISRVKNELQTVIDLMGPSTPQFLRSSSNDGDNEWTVTSDTANKSSDKSKADEISEAYSQNTTDKTMPPDVTLQEDTDYSLVVEKNSTTLNSQVFQEIPQYVCPPPLMPASIAYNSECMCPQIANYIHKGHTASMPCMRGLQKEGKKLGRHKNLLYNLFKNLAEKSHGFMPGSEKCEYYTMNIKESRDDHRAPKRLVFDLVGDIPRRSYRIGDDFDEQYFSPVTKTKELKNFHEHLTKEDQQYETLCGRKESVLTFDKTSRKYNQKTTYADSVNDTTRVDVYYFDHGDSGYLKTTDSPPVVTTEQFAEKTEAYTTRFWAEIFGTLHIGVSFCISFILQLFRFLLYSLLRPLTVGLIQLGTDYFLKPCIATLFNAVVQPPLIFLYNVCTSLRDVCFPLSEAIGYFLREMAFVIRAFRIVDFKREKTDKITENVINTDKKQKVEEKVEEKTELVP